jgi:hypothetical protein
MKLAYFTKSQTNVVPVDSVRRLWSFERVAA